MVTQETAYASLLLSRRRELHRRVAECLEQIDAERVNEIARHFLEAQEQARALPYLVDAGDRSARAYSTPDAIGFYTQALEILETVQDSGLARRAYEGLGGALTFAYDVQRAVETYRKMLDLAKASDDIPMQVSALNKLGFVTALMQGQLPEGDEILLDAQRLANQSKDLAGLAECHMIYCYIRTATGDFDNVLDHQSESAQIGEELNLEEPKLFGLTHMANTLTFLTRFDEAWEKAQEALQVAEEAGNQKYLSELKSFSIAFHNLRNGDPDTASRSAEEGMTVAARIGDANDESHGAYMLGQISSMRGEYERAIVYQDRALEAGRTAGFPYLQVSALCALGVSYLDISKELADKTGEFHTQAMQVMEMPLGTVMGALNWADLGMCALALGNPEHANELFQKGLTNSSAAMYLAKPQLLIGSALVALQKNNPEDAARFVREAREFVDERMMQHLYPLVALAEAHVLAAQGETEQALDSFARGEELALKLQMRPLVWQARAGAAQTLSALGRKDEAHTKRQEARAMIHEIAELFEDAKLRGMYLQGATAKIG